MLKSGVIQAVIIDLDGTLVDSAEDLRAALNKLLGELGLRAIELREVKGMIGDGVLKLVERGLIAANGDPAQKDALLGRFLEIYQANPATLTRCYPGVIETLRVLRDKNFRLAVVTNKPVAATKKILEALSLAEFFTVVVGGDSVAERKPHPAPVLEAARQLGVDVARCRHGGRQHPRCRSRPCRRHALCRGELWLPSPAAVRIQRRSSDRPLRPITAACHQADIAIAAKLAAIRSLLAQSNPSSQDRSVTRELNPLRLPVFQTHPSK